MDQPLTLKQKIILAIATTLGPILIKTLGFTWKITIDNPYKTAPKRKKGIKRIYCFWHNRLLALAFTERKKNVGILISSHFDGEIIARIVNRMGYNSLRGSSTRGGNVGLLSMLREDKVWYLAITVDGPRGPRGVVKPGAIFLAAKSGLELIPVSCDTDSKWVLPSWDGFQIPKPFAKVNVSFGKPVMIKEVKGHNDIKKHALNLAAKINELNTCT